MANLTDADKVLRNDTGKDIVTKLNAIKTAIENSGGGSSTFEGLSDVDIDDQTLTNGQVPKYNSSTQKWENGDVSLVGNLDDLNDVDTSGKASGDSLRYNGNEWVAKPTTIEMTQAEYNAIVDFTPYANTHIVITDAPNLNPTAQDISYDGSIDTVWDKVEAKANKTWEYIGKITNGDTGLDVSNKSEVLIVGFANNNTRYLSFTFPMAEIVGVSTVIVIEGTGTNKYAGEIAVDNNYKITTTQYTISGWSSMYLKVYAR